MPSQADVIEIGEGNKPQPKRKFDAQDFSFIAEYVIDTYETRKRSRSDRERHWAEVDRQIAMVPDIGFKRLPNGEIDARKLWMAEMELPLQAQTLEVLTADARRMEFPDSGPWFRAHTETTDEYLSGVDFTSLILGDENEVPSQINQDNADKLAEGFLLHYFRQTDFASRMDLINAEAFKYGMGVGRGRIETKNVYIHEARGVRPEKQKIPVLVPVSIKNLYLDEPMPSMHSAQVLGPAHIACDHIKLANLAIAASKGSDNPDDPDGGWMPKNLNGLEADDNGYVKLLEMEGDIIVPRKTTRSVVIPGAIVTVAVGGKQGGDVTQAVIRFRFRKQPFSSYLLFPYQFEAVDSHYPESPLMKGRPVQIMAVDALNRLMDSAALKNAPPVGWDGSNINFAKTGGPEIFPGAKWESIDGIEVFNQIGGDADALSGVLSLAINLYSELTGVLPARLGAQTVSHTTAFAKDAELQRGAVRTVDYVRQSGQGPITRWLEMAYQMGRDELGPNETIACYIDAYGGFVELNKKALPKRAIFEWFGAGGPQEEATKMQSRMQSLQMALNMDQLAIQTGNEPSIDLPAAIREILREGKWTDVDSIVRATGGSSAASGVPGPIESNPGAQTVALQALSSG